MSIIVFISYTIKDSRIFKVSQLAKLLLNYTEIEDVLYCEEYARDDFIKYMNDYLDKCDVLLLFCSPNSLKSEFVAMEWRAAVSLKKTIIPVYMDPKYIPPLLSPRLGVQFDENDVGLTVDNIILTIKKNLSSKSSIITHLEEKIPFRGKKVRYSEYEILKELQEEINNLVEIFEVNENGFVVSLDFSSIYLESVPKTIRFFTKLMEVNFSGYSFTSDGMLMNLKFDGLIIKFEGRPYQNGEVKVRIEREKGLSRIGEKNAKTVDTAKGSFCSEDWDNAIKLFQRSKEICLEQGWLRGGKFAERMIRKAKEELKKENEQIKKGIKGREEIFKLLPDYEIKILKNIEKNLNKPIILVEEIKDNTRKAFTVKNNHISGISLYREGTIKFPEEISQLTYLKKLNLSRMYNLITLPDIFGEITSLEELYLHSCKITQIPDSFQNLTSLRILELNKNKLESFPPFLGKLQSLEFLDLRGNLLSEVPDSIEGLKSLHTLYLNFNKLKRLPETIGNLTALKTLFLNFNMLITLPDSICELKSLEYLNVRDNFLTILPDKLADIISLKELVINGNNFKEVPRQAYYLEDRGVNVLK